jgi:hypothetical protein
MDQHTSAEVPTISGKSQLKTREILFIWCCVTIVGGWIAGAIVGAGEVIFPFMLFYAFPVGLLGFLGHMTVRWLRRKAKG